MMQGRSPVSSVEMLKSPRAPLAIRSSAATAREGGFLRLLFVSAHWIDVHSATRRDVASGKRDEGQQRRKPNRRRWIARATPKRTLTLDLAGLRFLF
jgi:hypothetical protein